MLNANCSLSLCFQQISLPARGNISACIFGLRNFYGENVKYIVLIDLPSIFSIPLNSIQAANM